MACSTVWKNPKYSVKLSVALFDLSMWSLNLDLESSLCFSPPASLLPAQACSHFLSCHLLQQYASLEREGLYLQPSIPSIIRLGTDYAVKNGDPQLNSKASITVSLQNSFRSPQDIHSPGRFPPVQLWFLHPQGQEVAQGALLWKEPKSKWQPAWHMVWANTLLFLPQPQLPLQAPLFSQLILHRTMQTPKTTTFKDVPDLHWVLCREDPVSLQTELQLLTQHQLNTEQYQKYGIRKENRIEMLNGIFIHIYQQSTKKAASYTSILYANNPDAYICKHTCLVDAYTYSHITE